MHSDQFTPTHRYLHGPLVDMVLAEDVYDPQSGQIDATHWALADHLGTVRDVVRYDAAEQQTVLVQHVVVDAFGNIVEVRDGEGLPLSEPPMLRFVYTGREYDAETGLYYYRARYYDPAAGRFLSPDPIGFAAGDANLYRYVGNAATIATDPWGLAVWHRVEGGLSFLFGAAETAVGVGVIVVSGWTGVGLVVGAVPTVHGVDVMQAGARQLISGEKTNTVTSNALQGAGLSEDTANLVDAGVSVVGTAGAGVCAATLRSTPQVASTATKGAATTLPKAAAPAAKPAGAATTTAADGGIVAQNGTTISGYTKHGVNRAIGNSGDRAGTSPQAILDALKNPKTIKCGVDDLGRPFEVFTGQNARVVVNPQTGEIVSVNPLGRGGVCGP